MIRSNRIGQLASASVLIIFKVVSNISTFCFWISTDLFAGNILISLNLEAELRSEGEVSLAKLTFEAGLGDINHKDVLACLFLIWVQSMSGCDNSESCVDRGGITSSAFGVVRSPVACENIMDAGTV